MSENADLIIFLKNGEIISQGTKTELLKTCSHFQDMWNTLHQTASISKFSSPSIDPSMLKPLLIMTIAFTLIGLIIAILRIKAEIIERSLK